MYIAPKILDKVTSFMETLPTNLASFLDISFTHLEKLKVVAEMPVAPKHLQPFGVLHGGATAVLAESAASIGAWLNIDEDRQNAVGIELNVNHIRKVTGGHILATAIPLHLGKSTQVWNIEIKDENSKITAVSRCTMAVISKKQKRKF